MDLKAAQHLRQAAEKELLNLQQKAAKVAGKLELTGWLLQVYIHLDGRLTLYGWLSTLVPIFLCWGPRGTHVQQKL